MPSKEYMQVIDIDTLTSQLHVLNRVATEVNTSAFARQAQNPDALVSPEEAILRILTETLELRHRETMGHTQRVTEISVDVAKLAGFGTEDLEYVRRGALIHDIGKLKVRNEVLEKPGKLDPLERAEMERHVEIGVELVSPIPYFRPALAILQYHHEKWDGTGYPYRFKGEEIPLAARIFSIVDVWDAVTHKRVYKEAWPIDTTRDYIKSESGKHFDPQVVELFLHLESQRNWY